MNKELKIKLEKIIALVNDGIVHPDIDLEYCIPEVETTKDACDIAGSPYILLTYVNSDHQPTRKISLGHTALQSSPDELAKHVLCSIEEFKEDTDSVKMG